MIDLIIADLENPVHAAAILTVLNDYASDPTGGGQELSAHVQKNLIASLKKRSNIYTILAFRQQQPAGIALCIEGFSTFACKPLLNIHDFAVLRAYRGQGIGKLMLGRVRQLAKNLGCCKITLEVLEGNTVARKLYTDEGFLDNALNPSMGKTLFMQFPMETE
ncbi:GNAT family N-acetyltransferase [Advenella sp. RU8]|uniref:GNAT family N-acetyltransferase n=1 Tax=Advenella sp. RU8 TaxID=3399575 RepID=UPI003AACE129